MDEKLVNYDSMIVSSAFYGDIKKKTDSSKITHQDLGQLQIYVNYFDRYEKLPEENPTVGILLCAAKNDTLVKITLPEDNTNILTSQYQLYLPSEESLLDEIKDVLQLAEGGAVDE